MTNDWSSWTAAAFRGASLGVDEWRLDAEFVGVRIVGGLALAGPGTLRSPVSFAKTIRAAMTNAQAPPAVADAVSSCIWQAWKQWADGATIPGLPWYPAFFAWPAPVAPPTPNIPTPLSVCVSTGILAMTPSRLATAIKDQLGSAPQPPGTPEAIDDLAEAFSEAFMTWTATAMVMLALGAGTAPVAYPFVPVGLVTGTLVNNGRGCLAAAVPFPDTPPLRS